MSIFSSSYSSHSLTWTPRPLITSISMEGTELVPQWQGFRGSKSLSLPMRNNQLPALFNGVMVYRFMCHRALYRDGTPWAVWSPRTPCLSLAHILGCFAACWLPLINPLPGDTVHGQQHTFYRRADCRYRPPREAPSTPCSLRHEETQLLSESLSGLRLLM